MSMIIRGFWMLMLVVWAGVGVAQESDPGEGYFQRGQFELAVEYWEGKRSKLFIGKEEGSTTYQLKNLSNSSSLTVAQQLRLAEAYQQLGRLKDALKVLQEANFHIQKIQDSTRQTEFQAGLHSQLGDVYLAMGSLESQDCKGVTTQTRQATLRENQQRAENSLYLAKGFADKINHPLLQASILNQQGNLWMTQKNYEEALKKYEEATTVLVEQDKLLKAKILVNIAQLKVNQGNFEAENAIKEATVEVENLPDSDSHDKSFALIGLARLWKNLQQSRFEKTQSCSTISSFKEQLKQPGGKQRFDLLMKAMDVNKIQEDRRAISYAKGYLAELYLDKGCYSEAKELTQQALIYAQTYPQPMAEDVTKKLWGYPELLFQWEWQLGKILKAQGQSEQQEAIRAYGRAAGHLETARKNYAGTTPTFSKDGETFYLERAELLLNAAKSARDEDKQNLLKTAIDSIESRQEAGLRNYFQDECITEKFPVEEERRLQDNEALLYLVMFGNCIESVLKFSDGSIQQETGLCNSCNNMGITLGKGINSFRKEVIEDGKDISNYSKGINSVFDEAIIAPLKRGLVNHNSIDTLLIIPSGESLLPGESLLRVPFAALPFDQKTSYLIESYAIAVLPNWRLSSTPLRSEDLIVLKDDRALLAGLVIERPKGEPIAEGVRSICTQPLEFVKPEITELQRIIPSHDTLWEADFTAQAVENSLTINAYPIVHLSTHGKFEENYNNSWLCTYKRNERLALDKLEEILQGRKVKLLTLSACETALGAELGLAGIGVKAGTRSALGSLWPVNDKSTAILMQRFYENLRKDNLEKSGDSIAKALQNTQWSFFKEGKIIKLKSEEEKGFKLPFYWAGFLLIGNWQNSSSQNR